jgi:hypothetical protein
VVERYPRGKQRTIIRNEEEAKNEKSKRGKTEGEGRRKKNRGVRKEAHL